MNPNMLNPKTKTEIISNGFFLDGHTRRQYAFADMAGSSFDKLKPAIVGYNQQPTKDKSSVGGTSLRYS